MMSRGNSWSAPFAHAMQVAPGKVEVETSSEAMRGLAVGLPPGLLRPPPGLSLPPPPGLGFSDDEDEVSSSIWMLAVTWHRGGSDCSTADSFEAAPSLPSSPSGGQPVALEVRHAPPQEAASTTPAVPLRLADALPLSTPQGQAQIPAVPSVGSVGHYLGFCRPCDFAHRSGGSCREGAACRFCHICGPEASKLRRKQRKQFFSAMKKCQRSEVRFARDL
uniref:C3H1-type domain-containing protein n=1 Tax=Pyrodinium bahamense TaxID=73915 RepID=A0A7S0FAI2_9DINO|mmetsp:Transcript_16900/g.46558  ORF Transcript_16900/g.46558 Transcript_16900/m.46558 type:complete len:220 (+) Transcript_16900:75-734(+)|eukprot:CAMPEP_0179081214 /NCGR_PEP_ID=MMETSP0796-20121207/36554_1 /TAXON_ID=73915 /ORGANISM="Pyrodinium bahamense, Strain pbaha01" /LENGTH=219 /DNA_ID=CAMNT_0020778597 /DNA_START=75 /DNA_END=734 /DNA_ORIENTATION=-